MNEEFEESDFLQIEYDYIEYYVGMAKMVAYWHVKALGFKVIAYCGPETGVFDRCSYYIKKNKIRLIITSASQPSSYSIVSFVDLHGNGIKRIAMKVGDVFAFFDDAVKNGAIPAKLPERISDEKGFVELASFKIFDDNEIVIVNNEQYYGDFMPGYKNVEEDWDITVIDSELESIDHIACALRVNEIRLWEGYFNNIFHSKTVKEFDERQIDENKRLGILLKVLQSENRQVNNVLVEPDNGTKSQVGLFVDQNYGSGIQHIAFTSTNITKTVELLRNNGVKFTKYPDSYYINLEKKCPNLDILTLQKYGIICDVQEDSLLFQIFTSPIGDRSTFFYEIVQRVNNYDGFGLDNIRALFEALESEINSNNTVV